jgi:hypothetical protein
LYLRGPSRATLSGLSIAKLYTARAARQTSSGPAYHVVHEAAGEENENAWENWRRIQVHFGGKHEPPSCIMLIEPVSQKQPVTIVPALIGGLRKEAEPDGQLDNAGDGVEDGLRDAYYSDTNYL